MSSRRSRGERPARWPKNFLAETGEFKTVTHSAQETQQFGRALAKQLVPPCLILLQGELGSGKTTLTKGIVTGLGAAREEEVTSPSFTLVHEYGGQGRVYHIDLYRVETAQELSTLGLEDIFAREAVVLVEWGEKLGANTPHPALQIQLDYAENDDRAITVKRLKT